MATPDPSPTAPSPPQQPPKPRALIVISSARTLPLAQPSGHPGISTGFFLVEMAKVLQAFGHDYDLVFATPDGQPPQLDINGMALSFHAVPGLGPATARAAVAQATRFDADTFRQRRPQALARRDAELATAYQLLGRLPVSQPLPTPTRKPSSSATTLSRRSRRCPSTPTTRCGSWWHVTATPRTRSSCETSRSSTCPAGTPR
jgi:hypothetical protein